MSLIMGSGGLTPEEQEKIDQWAYDPENNRMSTDASVRSGLNSFELAEMHTTHSGGENVFDQNNVSGINWFPVWQGVKPLETVGEHLGLNGTGRQYGDTYELLTNGNTATSNNVPYTSTVTLLDNESVLRLNVLAGEAYTGKVHYLIKDTSSNGRVKYKQAVSVDVAEGDMVQFDFTHPSESRNGDVIHVDMFKDDDSNFLVKSGSNTSLPWLKITLANYEDIEYLFATKLINSGFTIRYSGDYECDVTGGSFTITVPADFMQAFNVSDALDMFNPTSKVTVDFYAFNQGLAVLQTSKDAYKFYYVNGQWLFKDLNTKSGGVV